MKRRQGMSRMMNPSYSVSSKDKEKVMTDEESDDNQENINA